MKTRQLIGVVCSSVLKLAFLVIVIIIIYRGAGIAYDYGYRVFMEPAMSSGEGRTVSVAITEDITALALGELFYSKGLVRDAKLFSVQYLLSEFRVDMKPGIYELSTSMTADEMLEAMTISHEEEE